MQLFNGDLKSKSQPFLEVMQLGILSLILARCVSVHEKVSHPEEDCEKIDVCPYFAAIERFSSGNCWTPTVK